MADVVRKVNYCYAIVPNRAGQGAKVLGAIAEAGINLMAYSGFPSEEGAQLDLVAEDTAALRQLARKRGWKISTNRRAFLIQGRDSIGAVHRHADRLAENRINIIAADAICAGGGRYGMLLWVSPKDYPKAARVLGAR